MVRHGKGIGCIMTLLTRELKQTCVYWPKGSVPFGEFGTPTRGALSEINCRWEDKAEEFVDAKGTQFVSRAIVYVGQDVEVGGLLYLGTSAEVAASGFPANPRESASVFEIRVFEKLPNFKATRFLRKAIL